MIWKHIGTCILGRYFQLRGQTDTVTVSDFTYPTEDKIYAKAINTRVT